MLLDDFSYRAVMDNGVVENELCPVVAAIVDADPTPNPSEVDDYRWVSWEQLRRRADERPNTLSPWAVTQIGQLAARHGAPTAWFADANASGGPIADRARQPGAIVGDRCTVDQTRSAGRGAWTARSTARRLPARVRERGR